MSGVDKILEKKTEYNPAPEPVKRELVDLTQFKSALIQDFKPHYAEHQWEGFAHIINKYDEMNGLSLDHLAYILATTYHETAHTMRPVTEYGSQSYLRSKSYWPYIGRGYVQLTWRENYAKYGIADTPEKALDPDFSAYVLIDGMTRGVFTGRKLSDYFNETKNDPVQARRIVNGMDRADLIAGYHYKILAALKRASSGPKQVLG